MSLIFAVYFRFETLLMLGALDMRNPHDAEVFIPK